MTALPFVLAASSLFQAAPASQPRRVVVSSGDEIVVPAGTTARILSRRQAQLRIVAAPERREVVVLVDEEKDGAPPDGLVDRAYRYVLQDEFPEQYTFRGEGAVEDLLEIKDGDLRRPAGLIFITPAGRLSFSPSLGDRDPGTTFFRSPSSHGSTLTATASASRSFHDVEYLWLNHLENSQPGMPATSVRLTPAPGAPVAASAPGATDSPARALLEVNPSYTADAMQRKIEGRVDLQVTVQPDGTVSDAIVVRSLDPELDAEALKAVKKWRFAPALRGGQPVVATVPVQMHFTLASR